MGLHPRSLTASLPLKNGGKGRRSGFLLGFGDFSGAFAVKHREGTSTKVAAFEIDLFAKRNCIVAFMVNPARSIGFLRDPTFFVASFLHGDS